MKKSQAMMFGVAVLAAASAQAGTPVTGSIRIPTNVSTSATASGCENNPGPFITLNGEIALGGIQGRLIFANNQKLTHEHDEDVTVDVVLLPKGETIKFAKQPPQGGVGGNPWIYLQFFDENWNAISDSQLLGRCVQGLSPNSTDIFLGAGTLVDVTTGDCANNPGPYITLSGEIRLGGINAKLIFQNNAKGTHTHEEAIEVSVEILPAGQTITFNKQPPLGGVGGNPYIWFQFLDGSGNPLGDPTFLGRCVQLSH